MCGLLSCATALNYLDRQLLPCLKPALSRQLHWSNSDFGWINGSFALATIAGALAIGWIADRWAGRIGYALMVGLWSATTLLHALVSTVFGFSAVRFGLGFGEGGNFPWTIKLLACHFTPAETALATSIVNVGSTIGALAAPALVAGLAFDLGWRSVFLAGALLGACWVAVWLVGARGPDGTAYSQAEQQPVPWRRLLRCRSAWAFIAAKGLTDPVWGFFLIWTPDFFETRYRMDLRSSWIRLAAIYLMVTVLGVWGGWFTGRLVRLGWEPLRARWAGMVVAALAALPVAVAPSFGPWAAVLLVGLAGAAHQAWSANLFTTVSDAFPAGAVASVVGMGSVAGAVGSWLFPIVTGMELDRFESFGQQAAAYRLLFLVCGCAYLVALGLMRVIAPADARWSRRASSPSAR